jgi:hypothetical protein
MAALALMYLDYWDSDSLVQAIRYLLADPMHERGWLPFAYAGNGSYVEGPRRVRGRRPSSRRRLPQPSLTTFSDGSAALTAVLYGDALSLFVAHARRAT